MKLLVILLVQLGGVLSISDSTNQKEVPLQSRPLASYFTKDTATPTQQVWFNNDNIEQASPSTTDPQANLTDADQVSYFQSTAHRRIIHNAPSAYSWGYRWVDEFGNQMFREETADGQGSVFGRYSHREANGILRIVEFVADSNGFRSRIRSNEPGLVSSSPANTEIIKFDNENNIPE